jgi:hypothetical protein
MNRWKGAAAAAGGESKCYRGAIEGATVSQVSGEPAGQGFDNLLPDRVAASLPSDPVLPLSAVCSGPAIRGLFPARALSSSASASASSTSPRLSSTSSSADKTAVVCRVGPRKKSAGVLRGLDHAFSTCTVALTHAALFCYSIIDPARATFVLNGWTWTTMVCLFCTRAFDLY